MSESIAARQAFLDRVVIALAAAERSCTDEGIDEAGAERLYTDAEALWRAREARRDATGAMEDASELSKVHERIAGALGILSCASCDDMSPVAPCGVCGPCRARTVLLGEKP